MTVADITLATFTLCNSLRVLAYIPQIAKAASDRSGGEAISFATWGLFLLSNMSAVAYALVNRADWTMATMFLGNAVACAIILLIGLWKRAQHRNRFLGLPIWQYASARRPVLSSGATGLVVRRGTSRVGRMVAQGHEP